MKELKVRNTLLTNERPCVCVPLIGKSKNELLDETKHIIQKEPDLIEWRADFFEDLVEFETVLDALEQVRKEIGDIPLLFTIRSIHEGGQKVELNANEKIELIKKVCATRHIDFIDYELENNQEHIEEVQKNAEKNNVKLILSFHDFHQTPDEEEMLAKFHKASNRKADIAKLAVMPKNMKDVLAVLQVTEKTNDELAIPVVTMAMGADGAITRLAGWKTGSLFTFGIGKGSSAPGQVPIELIKSMEAPLKSNK
ncbi:type I 3-dehydroquinate dehydratase [Marinococcus sp. PL1-022]|uniref:type I 3-dehydroquinate dehydratase n=1 Tax=Marinococcus sp. PL1-022 TaxID=3095363 RepID=UPI0029C153A8|nr:type I 3-dehydroquinate dehydratase [Marinococcus sp. PL1-022]MDX6151534.1 type I 3-dehydroquinate dehydratase [Marinococcus sp. PL1-022]